MRYYLLLLCLIILPFAFGQNRILDSLYIALKNHPEKDTIRLAIIFDICLQEYTNRPEVHKRLAEEALQIAEQIDFPKGIGTANGAIALYYWVIGEYEKATRYAYKMLSIHESINYQRGIGQSYQMLGLIHQLEGEYSRAKDFYDKAVAIYLKESLDADLAWCYNLMGTFYLKLSQLALAEEYFSRSLQIRQRLNDEDGIGQVFANLARLYTLKNDPENALAYFKKSLGIALKFNNKFRMTTIYTAMGQLYTLTAKYDTAEFYLFKSIALAKSFNGKKKLEEAYNQLVALEKKRGGFAKAIAYRDLESAYQDSLYTESKSRKIAEIEAYYESEKKEQAIKLLEQEKKIQKLWTNALITGSLLLLVALITIYRLQHLRSRKAKELLDIQKKLNENLKDAHQLKSRFFANVSHEFRTPLSLILAPIESKLKSGGLSQQDRDDLRLVNRNAHRLLDLINQLLDMSKLEEGKMVLKIQAGNLNEFVKMLIASFDVLAERRNISFLKDIEITSEDAWYDADKLEKIINNILSNAIKFTPIGGTVTLSAFTSSETGILTIRVTDNGRGIPKKDLQHIFLPFYQIGNTAEDGQQGTGLGLSLVNELVKLYQGKIEITSQENVGTRVSIALPFNKEKFPKATQAGTTRHHYFSQDQNVEVFLHDRSDERCFKETDSDEMHAESILIVEDNPELRNFIAGKFLDNFAILAAKNGEEGFSIAIEKIPTLILSDVMMPKMNGIELTQKLKADERTSHIPIILLTAKTDFESRIEGLKTGADDYLPKPFSIEELQVRIINLIEQRRRLAEKFQEEFSALPKEPRELSLDDKFIMKATLVVEANMSDAGFGIERFAAEMNLSRTQLFRKMKALLGVSPSDFVNNLRLQKASDLILAKADTLSQICYTVGFNEPSYFAKRFRKKFGLSPSEYAKSAN
ncbi:ATP-binding protein [Chryseolinea sp. H1M3-3]|uniref:ATP-binding protein n=1 Tax=Chryseolinea sp. H1M3-3 TaxID=3034144 RepID=UPI0023EBA2E5|nr:ATP-binding protein [Chryseolinea sp. H1M3-3]